MCTALGKNKYSLNVLHLLKNRNSLKMVFNIVTYIYCFLIPMAFRHRRTGFVKIFGVEYLPKGGGLYNLDQNR